MSPLDVSRAIAMASDREFDEWLGKHGASEPDVIVAIYKKASGKQTVTVEGLVETALCHGWIDSLATKIDEESFALRFTPRREGSNWSAKNRLTARRLLEEGRMTAAGRAVLPDDL